MKLYIIKEVFFYKLIKLLNFFVSCVVHGAIMDEGRERDKASRGGGLPIEIDTIE